MLYCGWQNETAIFMHCMRNAPQVGILGGVSIPILRAGLNAQACCHLLSRQAICRNSGRLPLPRQREGMKQRSHSYTACTPFPCRYGDGNATKYSILQHIAPQPSPIRRKGHKKELHLGDRNSLHIDNRICYTMGGKREEKYGR